MNENTRLLLNIKRLKNGLNPEIRILHKGELFKNDGNTGGDQPAVGDTWKEYWQIFTQEDFPTTCPMCGLPMTEDEIDGCQIKFAGAVRGRWTVKKFIVPGHHACNMQLDDEFFSHITVKTVEAIKKK